MTTRLDRRSRPGRPTRVGRGASGGGGGGGVLAPSDFLVYYDANNASDTNATNEGSLGASHDFTFGGSASLVDPGGGAHKYWNVPSSAATSPIPTSSAFYLSDLTTDEISVCALAAANFWDGRFGCGAQYNTGDDDGWFLRIRNGSVSWFMEKTTGAGNRREGVGLAGTTTTLGQGVGFVCRYKNTNALDIVANGLMSAEVPFTDTTGVVQSISAIYLNKCGGISPNLVYANNRYMKFAIIMRALSDAEAQALVSAWEAEL